MTDYQNMTTDDLAYHRSEIQAMIKPFLFVKLTDGEKCELRELKRRRRKIDTELKKRQITLPGFGE